MQRMKNVVISNASSTTALAMIRSLGRRGIPVIATDSTPYSVGFMSRYCMRRLLYQNPIESPRESLATLVKIGHMFKRPVLLPGGDDIIFLAMKYRHIIEKAFIFPLPPNERLQYTVDKGLTMQLASKEDVPIPRTFTPTNLEELHHLKNELTYPVVIKPRINIGFRNIFRTKLIKAWSFEELVAAHKLVSKYFSRPLIQEYIPGGTTNLYSLGTVFDRKHRSLGVCVERKLHQLIEGVTSCGETVDNPKIVSLAIKILKAIKWFGPAEVEFKRDSRDGEFKLIEINPRPFMWVNLPIKSGLDIPFLWYKIALEETCEETIDVRKDLKFINLFHYFLGFLEELSSAKSKTEFTSYLRDLKGHFVFDLLSKEDMLPLLSYPFLLTILQTKEMLMRKKLPLNILKM